MSMPMQPAIPVGIVGYGAYIPRFRIKAAEIARVWGTGDGGLPVEEKAVPGLDEDVISMSIEAARNALLRAQIDPQDLGAVWIGSESHPYAVKPSSTVVAEALGATPLVSAGDWQFACKAGTEAMQAAVGYIGSGMVRYALAIGADTAQGRPSDALEYTAGAGAAAFILGPGDESVAILEASLSYVTDTPDFWRRPYQHYPEHGNRFTGDPAYFHHSVTAAERLLAQMGRTPADYAWVIFHQPNLKFPSKAATTVGFKPEQFAPGLLVGAIGNTYAAASPIGLTATLDVAQPGDKILLVSFGSGAGSDAMSFVVTDALLEKRKRATPTQAYVKRRVEIDYATYARYREKLQMA
ncbi:MAG: hydroxymethylglutaryl-CoA synthase [Anaerolineae bacterium]